MRSFQLVGTVVCVLWAAGTSHAQGVGASGGIQGSVVDPSGAAVPGAKIVSTDTQRGSRYNATTDTSGEYRLTGMAPGTYDVTAQTSGFGTEVQRAVVVSV